MGIGHDHDDGDAESLPVLSVLDSSPHSAASELTFDPHDEETDELDEDQITDQTPFLHGGRRKSGPTPPWIVNRYTTSKRVRFSQHVEGNEQSRHNSRKTPWQALFEILYGQLPEGDLVPMISWLSGILFVIIGGFWILDSLKDTVFASYVGLRYQPWAKFASVLFTLALTLSYNKLLDRLAKPTLFYLTGAFYTGAFLSIAGMMSRELDTMQATGSKPSHLLGWASYLTIESYGSLTVAMFWAFTNSCVHLEGAKSVYGLILAGAQIGAVVGSTLATRTEFLGLAQLFALGGCTPAVMALCISRFTAVYGRILPSEATSCIADTEAHSERPLLEGLRVVLTYPYVTILAGISCLYEMVLTVLDYEMKVIGLQKLSRHPHASERFAELMGHFGQATNLLSFFCSLLGTSFVVRKLGLPATLRIFPCLLILASVSTFLYPYLGVLFFFVSILKALSYALNEPCKEMLYIPTSDTIRFKAKSWIDVFGARTAKAFGSIVTNMARDNPDTLVKIGSAPCWLVSVVLLLISIRMGHDFESLQRSGRIIGQDPEVQSPPPRDSEDESIHGQTAEESQEHMLHVHQPYSIGFVSTTNGVEAEDIDKKGSQIMELGLIRKDSAFSGAR